jgi:hypothetical protein
LTGRSSNHRPGVLDCPVKPGNDTGKIPDEAKRACLIARSVAQAGLLGAGVAPPRKP